VSKARTDVKKHRGVHLWLTVSFWSYVFLNVIVYPAILLSNVTLDDVFPWLVAFVTVGFAIATFVLSIIHLVKIKSRKAFAIVSLVFSSIWVLYIIVYLMIGLISVPEDNATCSFICSGVIGAEAYMVVHEEKRGLVTDYICECYDGDENLLHSELLYSW